MKNLKAYNDFIKEEIIFNFDDENAEEMNLLKIKEIDINGEFLNYEKEFFENIGLTPTTYGIGYGEDNIYYSLSIRKNVFFSTGNERDRNIESKVDLFYKAHVIIKKKDLLGRDDEPYALRISCNTYDEKERISILKKLMKNLYIFMSKHGIDPESIKAKEEEKIKKQREQEEKALKMKDVDPYGEEQWTEEDVNRKLPPPPPPDLDALPPSRLWAAKILRRK